MKIVDFKHWLQNWLEINHIESNVPKSTIFPHRTGIVIGGKVRMGEKCRISQGVTIGSKSRFDKLRFKTKFTEQEGIRDDYWYGKLKPNQQMIYYMLIDCMENPDKIKEYKSLLEKGQLDYGEFRNE